MPAKRVGIQYLEIELDAKVVVDLVWGHSKENIFLHPILLDCRRLRRKFLGYRARRVLP